MLLLVPLRIVALRWRLDAKEGLHLLCLAVNRARIPLDRLPLIWLRPRCFRWKHLAIALPFRPLPLPLRREIVHEGMRMAPEAGIIARLLPTLIGAAIRHLPSPKRLLHYFLANIIEGVRQT